MAQADTGRGRGRPSTPVLTQKKITDAAVAIIKSRGYRALTMAGLAQQLGASSSALYNHVTSKRQVLILLQDRINQEIDCSAFGNQPWDLALEHWAWSYRNVYSHNIPLIPVISVMPVANSEHTLRMYDTVAAALVEAGWPPSSVVNTIVGLESLIFGSAYDATAPENIFDPGEREDLVPTFTTALTQRSLLKTSDSVGLTPCSPADAAFSQALTAMLMGLRAQLAQLHQQG